MTDPETHARRIAAGPAVSSFLTPPAESPGPARGAAPFDPLRLCIFATIALLGWLAGPVTLLVFAVVGFVGYWRARRAGLTRSKCYLRDTRLVLSYLGVLVAAAVWGCWQLALRVFPI